MPIGSLCVCRKKEMVTSAKMRTCKSKTFDDLIFHAVVSHHICVVPTSIELF